LGLMLILVTLSARSTTTTTEDTLWWSGLNEDEQVTAVEAAIAAYQIGFATGVSVGETLKHASLSDPNGAYQLFEKNQPRFPRTFGECMAAVTDFYMRHPSARL
jgi:hypothetical protein